MKVIRGSGTWKKKKTPLGIALGNFDGVHLGHQAILKNLIETCKKNGWTSAVYTFDPHPTKILAPKTAPLLIQTLEQKLEALEIMGVETVILEKFDHRFSKWGPRKFFDDILVKRLKAKALWTGYDFTFGFKRGGSVELLKSLCQKKGVPLYVTRAQFAKETLVSSTQIRQLIAQGKVRLVRDFLGRPFSLTGRVVKGMGLGGQMGIHTANLEVENELLPKTGIYATRTRIGTTDHGPWTKDQKKKMEYPSATSVGFNPTFPGKGFSVETHLIGFEGNLVGKKIEVAFLEWMRDELTFPNAETLAMQIQKDIAEAKKINEASRDYRQAG
ncbi:MAG: bifunctional riboflavin kinase/FAD synthetase [Deltaproteobacteria bacterium]|nr:bifunctional riboflavin kinase/FAD synthetase [Deltaproteobacteria bacterium]MDZ4225037.1 bifunctional riboflavin kinase/FAD synthetase [bacterium]